MKRPSGIIVRAIVGLGIAGSLSCNRNTNDQPQPVEIAQAYTLPSTILGQTRRINVYLPPSYAKGGQRYPVLYLLDGGVEEDFVHIIGIASLAADFRKIREFIVVGIEGIDRYHDLVPPSSVASDRQRLPTSGGSAAFRSFLAEELKPFVEARFRMTEETVLLGESAAGLFVAETFLRQPDLFAGYVAVSPMLWWDDRSLAREASSLLKKRPFPPHRRLYLTIADEGGPMREGIDLLVASLKTDAPTDLSWTFVPMEQETHGTTLHPAALAAVRRFFAVADSVN
jgi:predicted alpha/beta superfamily hydrolase